MRSVLDAFVKSPQNARNKLPSSVVATGCPGLEFNSVWPPQLLEFAFSGLTALPTNIPPLNDNTGDDPACCFVEFDFKAIIMLGLSDCLSKKWRLPFIRVSKTEYIEGGQNKRICQDDYLFTCQNNGIHDITPDYSLSDHNLNLFFNATIKTITNVTTNTIESTEIEILFRSIIGHDFFGLSSRGCVTQVRYSKIFPGENHGPWELDYDPINNVISEIINFSSKLLVTPINEDPLLYLIEPTLVFNCCKGLSTTKCTNPSWDCFNPIPHGTCTDPENTLGFYDTKAHCQDACNIPETFNCIVGVGCTDPNNGLGNYQTKASCEFYCNSLVRYNCVDGVGCISPGNGKGQYPDKPTCDIVCTGGGGGGLTTFDCVNKFCEEIQGSGGQYADRTTCQQFCNGGQDDRQRCCPGGSPSNQLICVVESACTCLDGVVPVSWQTGEGAYVGNYFGNCEDGAAFLTIRIKCDGDGNWTGTIYCGAAPIASMPLAGNFCNPTTSENVETVIPKLSPCCPNGGFIRFRIYQS